MMGLVAKKHQAFNPYSFQTIAREHRPTLNLSFYEQGPVSMVCSQGQSQPGLWRIGFYDECYLQARMIQKPFRLEIENDKWGTRPCFYFEDSEKFIFSSDFYALTRFMTTSASMDEQAVVQYLKTGVLWGGRTFFQELQMLPIQHRLVFDRQETVLEKKSYKNSVIPKMTTQEKLKGLIDCFEKSVNDWVQFYGVKTAHLSGGADTRFILAALSDEIRSEMTFLTDSALDLKHEDDRDVVIARQLAKKFSLKHRVRDYSTAYKVKSFKIQALPGKPTISGYHGGEILGLEVLNALDFYFEAADIDLDDSVKALLSPKIRPLDKDNDRSYKHGLEILFQSFFTDIYDGGIFNDWTRPHQFIQRKLGPFWNSKLIDFILALEEEFPQSYDLYASLYQEFYPEFTKIPFHSVLTHLRTDFKSMDSGVDQKDVFKDIDEGLSVVELKKQNARVGVFSPTEFERLLLEGRNSVLLKRCLKLNSWMDELELVAKKDNWPKRFWAKIESAFEALSSRSFSTERQGGHRE